MRKTFTIERPNEVHFRRPLANKVTIDLENETITCHDHEIKDYKGLVRLFKVILNTACDGNKRSEFEILENHPSENEITIKGDNLYFVEKCEQLEFFSTLRSQEMQDFISQTTESRSKCSIL